MDDILKYHKQVQKTYKDPRTLLKRVWEVSIPGAPKPTALQNDMIQYITTYAGKRCMLQAFRGCGKSWVTAVAAIWYLIQNPQMQIMIVSAAQNKSIENANFIHTILATLPELNYLQPRADQRNSVRKFDVSLAKPSQSASIYCVGIGGQMEGSRADIIIADDIEIATNSATQEKREGLANRTNEFESIIKPDYGNVRTKIIMLGTPQTQESIYTKLRQEHDYSCRIYPVVRPTDEEINEIYKGDIAPLVMTSGLKIGSSIEPMRFSDEYIEKKRLVVGESYFRLHFMLDCSLSDAYKYPLKASDMIVRDNDKEVCPEKVVWASSDAIDIPCMGFNHDRFYKPMQEIGKYQEYDAAVMAIDISGKGSDETAYAVAAIKNGYVYILDFGGMQAGYEEETLLKLAKIAKLNNVSKIIMESNFGGGMGAQLLRPILNKVHPCQIEDLHNTKQKELRIIDTLEPVLNRHRFVMDKSAVLRDYRDTEKDPNRSLIYQLTHITRERGSLIHDDRVDALAMAVGYWVERLNIDVDDAMEQDWLDSYLREEGEELGLDKIEPTWGDYLK